MEKGSIESPAQAQGQNAQGRTCILGLGNPLLGDDGVGWRVAEECARRLDGARVHVDCHAGGGLSVMEKLVGYDRAILIDAMSLGRAPLGHVSVFRLEDLPDSCGGHLSSSHETNLPTALELGRQLGAHLPSEIWIVAVESPYVYDLCESLTPAVSEAIPFAVEQALCSARRPFAPGPAFGVRVVRGKGHALGKIIPGCNNCD